VVESFASNGTRPTRIIRPYHYRPEKAYSGAVTLGFLLSSRPGNVPGFSVRELPGKYSRRATNAQQIVRRQSGLLGYSRRLEELFAQAGQVQSVAVITDKFSGQSKGFGFVEMANAEEASKAIAQFNDRALKGRNIKVNEAKPRESSFGGGNRGGGGGGGSDRGRNRW
jgi:hypothetical protein